MEMQRRFTLPGCDGGNSWPIAGGTLEGVPGLPGAPQDEAGLTRKLETLSGPWR